MIRLEPLAKVGRRSEEFNFHLVVAGLVRVLFKHEPRCDCRSAFVCPPWFAGDASDGCQRGLDVLWLPAELRQCEFIETSIREAAASELVLACGNLDNPAKQDPFCGMRADVWIA